MFLVPLANPNRIFSVNCQVFPIFFWQDFSPIIVVKVTRAGVEDGNWYLGSGCDIVAPFLFFALG
jgi:hypothetical protein